MERRIPCNPQLLSLPLIRPCKRLLLRGRRRLLDGMIPAPAAVGKSLRVAAEEQPKQRILIWNSGKGINEH